MCTPCLKETISHLNKYFKYYILPNSDTEKIELWREVATNVQKLVQICKTLTTKNNILIFLKHMPLLLKSFLTLGMPSLEHNLKHQPEDVIKILKMMQGINFKFNSKIN